ncbi:hypothetical protein H0E86_01025 [Streptomyces sp. SCSIO-PteL053]|nr:hypothetical protein H0E86_01025 [Streptomyces sp. SCSIO-PteL053]
MGMAAGLLESSAVFAGRMAECAVALEGFTDWSLLDVVRVRRVCLVSTGWMWCSRFCGR